MLAATSEPSCAQNPTYARQMRERIREMARGDFMLARKSRRSPELLALSYPMTAGLASSGPHGRPPREQGRLISAKMQTRHGEKCLAPPPLNCCNMNR